jgi:serine/threonine protein phosphatase PrpC
MRHPLWLFATSTVIVSLARWRGALGDDPTSVTHAEAAKSNGGRGDCPFYGCPLTPQDVHYNTDRVKGALEALRQTSRAQGDNESQQLLATTGNAHSVTLTLIGYKGGPLQDQVNQDRALVVNPFYVGESGSKNGSVLLGVFDGHAPKGEDVSEFTKAELPVLLSKKLSRTAVADEEEVKKVLIETFVELDTRAPAEESGGCTATVVLKLDDKVYVANAGDSRSFLVAYRERTGETSVLYMSREDKPSLPDERARVEAMGGQVYIPIRGTSRVVYHDPRTGAPSGLAMSRSIGDWAAGKLGVIPDPIVDVIDMSELVDALLVNTTADHSFRNRASTNSRSLSSKASVASAEATVDASGSVMATNANEGDSFVQDDGDDVYIFAVCATDGMTDYLEAIDIATVLSKSLFDEKGAHPITAVEHLVFSAANAWQQDKLGRYRDDISIAVSTLRTPPSAQRRARSASSPDPSTASNGVEAAQ